MLLDIFNNNAFSLMSMTDAINKMPFQPKMLGSMGLFTPRPITTTSFGVEQKQGRLSVIQTSARGAPLDTQDNVRRTFRDFRTTRLAKAEKLYAAEIQNERAFGSETEVETMTSVVALKMADMMVDLQLTLERHRLGATAGIVLDRDDSTIMNFYTEFGITQPAEITFSNAAVTAAGDMRAFLQQNIVRPMLRSFGEVPGGTIVALVGDGFFDWLTSHPDVKATYLNFQAAVDLRVGNAFGEFSYGGVTFINYRGTDDNTTVAVASSKARFFMRGVPGLFVHAMSPGESFEVVNTRGREYYAMVIPDLARNMFVDIELYSYPLFMCTRPETLLRGTL
jgi:hypothetical protein